MSPQRWIANQLVERHLHQVLLVSLFAVLLIHGLISERCVQALSLLAEPQPARTLLTFDDLPNATVVTNQYGAKGVRFRNAVIVSETYAHSGGRVLYSGNPTDEFDPGPLIIDFASGQRIVKLYAGTVYNQITATLTAYDAGNNEVARDGPRTVARGTISTTLQVNTPRAVIRRIELLYTPNTFEIIDDLEFEGEAPPPVPGTAPIVTITAPVPPCRLCPPPQVSQRSYTVTGTVRGAQLASQALLKMRVVRPPGSSTISLYTYSVPLTGTGNLRSFAYAVNLGLGLTTITVEAENAAGLRGSTSSSVFYLPQLIRNRLRQTGSLGSFVFGGGPSPTAACTYAVYTNGAVAMVNGQTFLVRQPILEKWLSVRDQGNFPRLACPTGEQRDVVSAVRSDGQQVFDGHSQTFNDGRIYAHSRGTFLVPSVFADMIDALGGEPNTGLPMNDSTSDSRPTFKTWHFQQFRRPGVDLSSTLEIRGEPPRLFVERQAGDGSLFAGVRRPRNATIVQSYACNTTSGPCPYVPPPASQPFDAARFCNNETFNWPELVANAGSLDHYKPNPPEWAAIYGHYVQTGIWGAVYDAHKAERDNPLAHENSFTPCGPIAVVVNCIVRGEGTCCPSDWDVLVRPLPDYRWMQAAQRDHIAIEFEQIHAHAFMVGFGEPTPGDMVFASGRFISDCGHAPIKTEIHPPSVLAVVTTTTYRERPATQANIWVNAFFPGGTGTGDAVEFDVYPPPRPSPIATLGALYPREPAMRVEVTFSNVTMLGPVRVRVTAPRREPTVDNLGQMKWPKNGVPGGYQGTLLVYWQP